MKIISVFCVGLMTLFIVGCATEGQIGTAVSTDIPSPPMEDVR